MMFLIRTAFWLMVLVLLLPNDEQQRSEIFGTAQAAVQDVTTFCDRNPETCATGRNAFAVFMQKAQYGARMLMDMVNERTGSASEDSESASLPGPESEMTSEPALWQPADSQDTLSADDRTADWSGPENGA